MQSETKKVSEIDNVKLRLIQKAIASLSITLKDQSLLTRMSDANQLNRITAWIFRFKFNVFSRFKEIKGVQDRRFGALSREEIKTAQNYWIREEQKYHYAKEIRTLQRSSDGGVGNKSPICLLDPKLDKDGILRVGGRIDKSTLPYDHRHPALLPDVSWLAQLLIRQAHERTLHGGQRKMMAYLRQTVWIMNLNRAIKASNNKCIECTRQRRNCIQQMMGELPTDRVRPCRPFEHTGVDYAGPFLLKAHGSRCRIIEKKYVAVFICMATKAVHLELVEGLST